jgi:hypothetical protein
VGSEIKNALPNPLVADGQQQKPKAGLQQICDEQGHGLVLIQVQWVKRKNTQWKNNVLFPDSQAFLKMLTIYALAARALAQR